MGELKCGTRADAVERRFDGGLRRDVLADDGADLCMQARETLRQRRPFGEPDFPASDQFRLVCGTRDDGPTGAPGSRVDAQDPASVRQDAASETASSSKERLA